MICVEAKSQVVSLSLSVVIVIILKWVQLHSQKNVASVKPQEWEWANTATQIQLPESNKNATSQFTELYISR